MAVPARIRIETTSAQPRSFRGRNVTPPTGFTAMSQIGRKPAWLTTDFPCPKYDVSTKVDTGEPSMLVMLGRKTKRSVGLRDPADHVGAVVIRLRRTGKASAKTARASGLNAQ
jgi:hypothetical protein